MSKTSSMIPINPAAIRAYCASEGITLAELARRMGRTQSYLPGAFVRGTLSRTVYPLLVSVTGVPHEEFLAREVETPAPEKPAEKYSLNLDVSDDRVRLGFCRDGKEVRHAYSIRKGEDDFALMQGISYAAHMLYKFAEQDKLSKGGKNA